MQEARAILAELMLDDEFKMMMSKKIKEGQRLSDFDNATFVGRNHSTETKQKMSRTHKLRKNHVGEKNSQYGTCWIYNPTLKECKRVPKDDVNMWLYGG